MRPLCNNQPFSHPTDSSAVVIDAIRCDHTRQRQDRHRRHHLAPTGGSAPFYDWHPETGNFPKSWRHHVTRGASPCNVANPREGYRARACNCGGTAGPRFEMGRPRQGSAGSTRLRLSAGPGCRLRGRRLLARVAVSDVAQEAVAEMGGKDRGYAAAGYTESPQTAAHGLGRHTGVGTSGVSGLGRLCCPDSRPTEQEREDVCPGMFRRQV